MKFGRKKLLVSLSITALMAMNGCSKLDDARKNSEIAAQNSGRAANAAEESRGEIAMARLLKRSSSATDSRRKALKALTEAKTFERKSIEAGIFIKAFEFQTWTALRHDTPEYLNRLKHDATKEYFSSVREVFGGSIVGEKVTAIRQDAAKKDRDLNVMALAIAMHTNHNAQVAVGEGHISMLSIIQEALVKVEKVRAGALSYDSLLDHEKEVYLYRDDAIAILGARANMFMTMVLKKTSKLGGTPEEAVGVIMGESFRTLYFELSEAEQLTVNRYLQAAAGVKIFLGKLNEAVEVEETIDGLFLKMTVPELEVVQSAQSSDEGMTLQSLFPNSELSEGKDQVIQASALKNHQGFLHVLGLFYKIENGQVNKL